MCYLALSYALPILVGTLAYGLTRAFDPGLFSMDVDASGILLSFVSTAVGGFLFHSALTIGKRSAGEDFLFRN